MTLPLTSPMVSHWFHDTLLPCVFLDIDGTLAPFTFDPTDSQILPENLRLLSQLLAIGVPVAVVTGRSLHEARKMLVWQNLPLDLPIGATHGLEITFSTNEQPILTNAISLQLPLIIADIQAQACALKASELRLEKKPYSVALHYRENPSLADSAHTIMQTVVQQFPDWQLKSGKFVWEILPTGADKGQAVTAILAYFQKTFNQNEPRPLLPIFIGDDISDEAGFMAVQYERGIGIKVGTPTDSTHANFFVNDLAAVTQILQTIYQHCQSHQLAFCPNEASL